MFWGFSETLDLYEEYEHYFGPKDELNILLYGSGDPRFIIKLLSKYHARNVKFNIYICEGCIELHARHLLLLAIALESPEVLSVRAKTHLFMDAYGNAMIRPATYQYICSKANHLRDILTDDEYKEQMFPILNIEALRYKERDQLENAFEFWTNKPQHVFKMKEYWENRLRATMGVRFDTRSGAFDWDLQMKLKEYGAKTICGQEYSYFRETGIAFTFPEFEQCQPNKTFAVGLEKDGKSFRHRGCVGDFTVGPFIPFGVKCKDETMLKQQHGVGQFRATDITERNLFEMFYEIQERKPYVHDPRNTHAYGSAKLLEAPILQLETVSDVKLDRYDFPIEDFSGVKIHLLSVEDVVHLADKAKFKSSFDVIFCAANYFTFLTQDFVNLLGDSGVLMFETRQFSTMTKKEIGDFLLKIKNFSKENLEPLTNFNLNLPHSIVKYRKKTS